MTKRLVCLVMGLLVSTLPAAAQAVDDAGVRARGMGGAFTAVADDASATWWNPAGLAGGAYVSAILEFDRTDPVHDPALGASAPEGTVSAFSAAFPALGLSYYRFRTGELRPSGATATALPSRQNGGPAGEGLPRLLVNQFGVTVGQSLGEHLVVASTLKLLHGGPEAESAASETAGTLDLGAIARFGVLRLGLAVRNVTEPTLGPDERFTLPRQARAGAGVTFGGRGVLDGVTLAADADLTTLHFAAGDQRDVAGGAEVWLWQRRVGVRGGASVETVGDARASGSAGASVAVRSGLYVEGSATRGGDYARRGWGLALRVTF